jgi:hypothetical protein
MEAPGRSPVAIELAGEKRLPPRQAPKMPTIRMMRR